jgi:N-acetylglutamate synthase-like GNAT family acetyltransferase
LAWFSIYHKEELYHEKRGRAGFKIEANSAVLFDIVIEPDWQGKGIGSESLRFMKKYAKSRGAQRFYAHYVKPGRERFFAKAGFVRTDADPDWWIMREF